MSEAELNQLIAKNIARYLEAQNKTQLDLAEYVGVSQATVSNWCKGIKTPRMSKLDMICSFFNIERSDLFEEEATIRTAAAHLDSKDFTEDEWDAVQQFASFVKEQKNKENL